MTHNTGMFSGGGEGRRRQVDGFISALPSLFTWRRFLFSFKTQTRPLVTDLNYALLTYRVEFHI